MVFVVLCSTSCSKKPTKNTVTSNESQLVNSEKPESMIKDSITYYNGNQKTIELEVGEYFGFMFETEAQELLWKLSSDIDQSFEYVSESYEAQVDNENEKSNGIQLFTFKTLKKGKTKITFKSKNSKEVKSIHITIK